MTGNSVSFLVSHDSYLHVSCHLATLFLRDGYEVQFIMLSEGLRDSKDIDKALIDRITLSCIELDKLDLKYVSDLKCNILISATPPSILKKVSSFLRTADRKFDERPQLVTFFPGVLQEKRIEGLYERSMVDVLLLNSDHDLNIYQLAGRELGFDTKNALVTGFLGSESEIDGPCCSVVQFSPQERCILFIEQQIVPNTLSDRIMLLEKLIDLAHRSSRDVIIKLRSNSGSSTSVSGYKYHFEDIYNVYEAKCLIPSNLKLSTNSLEDLIAKSSLCISISSTAIFKAIARGVPVAIPSDFGIKDHFGNVHFLGSGCFEKFTDISDQYKKHPDINWVHQRISFFNSSAESISKRIQDFGLGSLETPLLIVDDQRNRLLRGSKVKYMLVLNVIKLFFLRYLWNR